MVSFPQVSPLEPCAHLSVIPSTQCIYNYVPETNHVPTVYSVAAALYLQFVLHVLLFPIFNMFCTFTSDPNTLLNVMGLLYLLSVSIELTRAMRAEMHARLP